MNSSGVPFLPWREGNTRPAPVSGGGDDDESAQYVEILKHNGSAVKGGMTMKVVGMLAEAVLGKRRLAA